MFQESVVPCCTVRGIVVDSGCQFFGELLSTAYAWTAAGGGGLLRWLSLLGTKLACGASLWQNGIRPSNSS